MNNNNIDKNRLDKETSPYLLQHKDNPVNWYPWCEEAFIASKSTKKPIFLSIGYSSCHWCHVMAHESFEDKQTAEIMNEHFINIKLDREERPDIDEIYMEALQLMTKHGGWPLSMFLTPELKPFYGGTYFPLEQSGNTPSFKDVLVSIAKFYKENPNETEQRAEKITQYLKVTSFENCLVKLEQDLNIDSLTSEYITQTLLPIYDDLLKILENEFDEIHGGFGKAPKFPQPSKISALLFSTNINYINHAILTLNKISTGGITDQIGGGISRYSVDSHWLIPHFEKMLYDNAQLISLFAAASLKTKNNNSTLSEFFKVTSLSIFNYLERDLKCTTCDLFFCAEDADSEGEEGYFYTFFYNEFCDIFGNNLELKEFATKYYNCSINGNFEGKNILTAPINFEKFCSDFNISVKEGNILLNSARELIFKFRSKKERPSLDNKCLLSWNSLAVTHLLHTAFYLNNNNILKRALTLFQVIMNKFKIQTEFLHVFTQNEAKIPAFCDDVSYLLECCSEIIIFTGSESLLKNEFLFIIKYIHKHFVDPETGTLFYSIQKSELINRPTKPEDNIIYSSNSAIFGSISKIILWLNSQGKIDILSTSDQKMINSLALIASANTFKLASHVPIACAQMLQNIKLHEMKNVLILSPSSLNSLSCSYSNIANSGLQYVVIGTQVSDFYKLENIHEFVEHSKDIIEDPTYTFCNIAGCKLPTKNILDILDHKEEK